jgi:hypothetical protein
MTSLSAVHGQGGNNTGSVTGRLPVIDIAGNLGAYSKVQMSELIIDVEYIPLETNSKCLIDRTDNIIVTADRIFVACDNYCYAFTRDGEFLTDIGRQGRGPGEWTSVVRGISVDETNRIVYLDVGDNILEYTWDGKFVREVKTPSLGEGEMGARAMNVTFLRDNLFLGWFSSIVRTGPPYWIVFDDKGATVKNVDNRMVGESKNVRWSNSRTASPAMASGLAYLKENINDTLYYLNRRHDLVPAFVFDPGRYSYLRSGAAKLPYMERVMTRHYIELPAAEAREYLPNFPMIFAVNKIFFSFKLHNAKRSGVKVPGGNVTTKRIGGNPMVREVHMSEFDDTDIMLGIYDIRGETTVLLDRDPVTHRYGLVNDIDGGLSFWPRYYTSTGEMVDVVDAYEMKDLLTREHFATHPACDPAAHAKLQALLADLDEADNPVIVIATLKK